MGFGDTEQNAVQLPLGQSIQHNSAKRSRLDTPDRQAGHAGQTAPAFSNQVSTGSRFKGKQMFK